MGHPGATRVPRNPRGTDNYSLMIYQSKKDRKRVYLHLLYEGEQIQDSEYRLYGSFKRVAQVAFLLVHYARTHGVDFKKAWDSDEVWS